MSAEEPEFDFVIIGAGAAGCVIANRLSARQETSVCLLEAGPPDRNPAIRIPLAFMILAQRGHYGWGYKTVAEQSLGGREIPLPQGKICGGTTSINGTVYMRGHPSDYDGWAELGNEGWSYEEVLPFFKKSEDNLVWRDSPFHGIGGEVAVSNPTEISPLVRDFLAAAEACGIPRTQDFNGEQQEGAGIRQLFQKNGRRVSAASAFLAPARRRSNMELRSGFLVNRLLIRDGRCVGVEGARNGRAEVIRARREVILSAGTIASPAILMRSGIGDAGALRLLGIEPVRHNPNVGRHYQDHVNITIRQSDPARRSHGFSLRELGGITWAPFAFYLFGRGLLANNFAYAGAFVRTSPELSRPDIQLIFWPLHREPGRLVSRGHSYQIMVHLLRPRSRGQITLSSADPRIKPCISTGLLSDERDVDDLLRGVGIARRVLARVDRGLGRELEPGDEVRSRADLAAYMRRTAVLGLHQAGTCRMGVGEDAVVDSRLRLRSVEGLRVADASIMPRLIGGNTAAPTMMIGERAADFILKDMRR